MRAAIVCLIFALIVFGIVGTGLWWMTDSAGNLDPRSSMAKSLD